MVDMIGNNIYLITDYVAGESVSTVHVDQEQNLSDKPVTVVNNSSTRRASTTEKLPLQRALARTGFYWSTQKKNLIQRKLPAGVRYVSVWIMEDRVGVGIFKEVDAKGNIIMYSFKSQNGQFVYGTDHVLGDIYDYTIKAASPVEKTEVTEELIGEGVCWQGKLKRFEDLTFRRKKGQSYFYLTSTWRVKQAFENSADNDYRRYKSGNYFLTKEEAVAFKANLQLFRQRQILGAQDFFDEV